MKVLKGKTIHNFTNLVLELVVLLLQKILWIANPRQGNEYPAHQTVPLDIYKTKYREQISFTQYLKVSSTVYPVTNVNTVWLARNLRKKMKFPTKA